VNSVDQPLIVVPALNEERTIGEVVSSLQRHNYHVLVVDDCSTDSTSVLANQAGADVLRLPVHLGVGGALRAGFRYALAHGYNSVVQVDADGQHPVDQISELISAGNNLGAHLVIGSRYLSDSATLLPSFPRRLSMRCLSYVASQISGAPLTDTTSGFRLIQQPLLGEFANEFPNYYLGDTFEATVVALRGGYNVVEIPAALSPRLHGASSVSTTQAIRLITKVLLVTLTGLHPRIRSIAHNPR